MRSTTWKRTCGPVLGLAIGLAVPAGVLADYYDDFSDSDANGDPDPNVWDIDNPQWSLLDLLGITVSHDIVGDFKGLRLFADRPGTLKVFDADALTKDPRVREVHLTRKPGHAIRMPPEDYDSWVLGHVTFAPDSTTPLDQQCATLRSQLTLKIEATHG